jgi:hypothetical protein
MAIDALALLGQVSVRSRRRRSLVQSKATQVGALRVRSTALLAWNTSAIAVMAAVGPTAP